MNMMFEAVVFLTLTPTIATQTSHSSITLEMYGVYIVKSYSAPGSKVLTPAPGLTPDLKKLVVSHPRYTHA